MKIIIANIIDTLIINATNFSMLDKNKFKQITIYYDTEIDKDRLFGLDGTDISIKINHNNKFLFLYLDSVQTINITKNKITFSGINFRWAY